VELHCVRQSVRHYLLLCVSACATVRTGRMYTVGVCLYNLRVRLSSRPRACAVHTDYARANSAVISFSHRPLCGCGWGWGWGWGCGWDGGWERGWEQDGDIMNFKFNTPSKPKK